ncbi:MAG: DUF421 domain-containing protein, partial [Acidobacteria bacterium]
MDTIIRAIVGYFVLLVVVRVLKRRAGSQLTPFEFVLIFLIGGIIILSTVDSDRSVTNCTCAVITVGLLHRALSWGKVRSPKLGAFLDGAPLVVIKNGEWQPEVVDRMMIRPEDIRAAARAQGVSSIEKV